MNRLVMMVGHVTEVLEANPDPESEDQNHQDGGPGDQQTFRLWLPFGARGINDGGSGFLRLIGHQSELSPERSHLHKQERGVRTLSLVCAVK